MIALNRKNSDHKPLVLKSEEVNWGPKPFKLFNCWLEDKAFLSYVNLSCEDQSLQNLGSKLKRVKDCANHWSESVFGNLNERIALKEKEQEEVDKANKEGAVRAKIKEDLYDLYQIQSSMLCQKARMNWMLKWERNTSFFHKAIARRRSANHILKLEHEGNLLHRPMDIKEAIFDHFKYVFSNRSAGGVFNIGNLPLKKLSQWEMEELVKVFEPEEIDRALRDTDSNKAPCPDGLNAGVLKAVWDKLRGDVISFFRNFHATGFIPRGFNSSFIALIPKSNSP